MGKSRWTLLLVAVAFLAAGVFPMLDALGFFAGSDERLNAPRWVVLVAASLFMMSGVYILLIAAVGEAIARTFGMVLGIAIVVGLALIVHWIAFGGGDRGDCSGGISALGVSLSGGARDLECRATFGYGALILDFALLYGFAQWLTQRYPGHWAGRALETLFKWCLGALFLPLILIALPLAKGREWVKRLAPNAKAESRKEKGKSY